MTKTINQLINDKGVSRTARATPGLLMIVEMVRFCLRLSFSLALTVQEHLHFKTLEIPSLNDSMNESQRCLQDSPGYTGSVN